MSETPSAYSVEEHMFRQDEIQKRHPQPTDQQRSEAVTEKCKQFSRRLVRAITPMDMAVDPTRTNFVAAMLTVEWPDQSAAIAERDATITSLRVAGKTAVRLIHSKDEQITTLQARVRELESGMSFAEYKERYKPTTEK